MVATSSYLQRDFDELQRSIERIWEIARGFGLDPFPTHFELVPAAIMYEIGAYGLPGRFSHWTHGRAYHHMKTMYDYGLSKIYELVINTNPCQAFLAESNTVLQNKLVAAHVLAHCDFFRHNTYFGPTSRQMVERAETHADRIRRYEFEHGTMEVEQFLDAVLSIQEHIDPNVFFRRPEPPPEERRRPQPVVNPYEDLMTAEERAALAPPKPEPKRLPPEPEKDVLGFVAQHAPDLKPWQRDVITIVRSEMLYFLPQMQTKIVNEGWASYWHLRILRELDLTDAESLEFAQLHAGVIAPSRRSINPYYVGLKMLEDIERRWDEPSEEERQKFDREPGRGREKLFEVRSIESDVSFLRNYLTEALVEELDLYVYRLEDGEWKIVDKNWRNVRDQLVASMTNFGIPYIVVEDADHRGNRELYLRHCYEGQPLDLAYAEKTLRYVQRLWGRTVHLESQLDGKRLVLSFDGKQSMKSVT